MEESGLARGKFEVAETKIKEYQSKKTKEASRQSQAPLATAETTLNSSPLTYSDLAVGVQFLAAVSAVAHDRIVLDLPFGMQAIAEARSDLAVGQLVPVVVVSVDVRGSFREVRVSLDPAVLNAALKPEKRMTLCASVKSVEAHGYALSFSSELSGFLPCASPVLKPGSAVAVAVTNVPRPNFVEASAELASQPLAGDKELKLGQVRVGFLVHCRVIEVLEATGNVVVSFLKSLTGVLNKQYFPSTSSGSLSKGQTLTARVVSIDRSNNFRLSALSSHVAWTPAVAGGAGQLQEGAVLKAKVKQVVTGQYVLLQTADAAGKGRLMCHFSRGGKTMALDEERKVKLLSENRFEGVWIVSAEKKVVESEIVTVGNVVVGQLYTATITQTDATLGVIVQLSEFISGRVPKEQLFDVAVKKPNMVQFQKGAKIKVRVLAVDQAKRQVLLTAKKTMVSDLSGNFITTNSQAKKDDVLLGYIRKRSPDGTCFVNFYGNAFGVFKASDDGANSTLQEGATVKVRVKATPASDEQPLKLTTDLSSGAGTSDAAVGAVVAEWRATKTSDTRGVEVKLTPEGGWLQARLVEEAASSAKELTVVGAEADGTLIVTGKSWVEISESQEVSEVVVPETLRLAYVTKVAEKCLFLSTGAWKAQGVVLAKDMGESFIEDAREVFRAGQTVICKIKEAQPGKKFTATLRKAEMLGNSDKYAELATLALDELFAEGKSEIVAKRITKFALKSEKPYGKIFSCAEWPGWTAVTLTENVLLAEGSEISSGELVVLDAVLDKKVLECVLVEKAKKRKASEFQVRLNASKDQYAVAFDQSSGTVGIFLRSKADKEAKLALGATVKLRAVDSGRNFFAVDLETANKAAKKAKVEVKLEVGDAVEKACVKSVHGLYADVEISGVHNKQCRVHLVDLSADKSLLSENDILENLVVLEFKRRQNLVWLGDRALGARPETAKEVGERSAVSGVVTGSSLKGVFVAISRSLTGRIPLKAIKPRPQSEEAVVSAFPVGKRLANLKPEIAGELVTLWLASEQDARAEELQKLAVGNVVRGVVRGKKKYGVFVEISGTRLSGLCLSKDCGGEAAMEKFQVGQTVVMEITKIENNKIWGLLANQSVLLGQLQEADADEELASLVPEEVEHEDEDDMSLDLQQDDEDEEDADTDEDSESESGESGESGESDEDVLMEEESLGDDGSSSTSSSVVEDALEDAEGGRGKKKKAASALKKKKQEQRQRQSQQTEESKKTNESPDDFEKRLIREGPGSAQAWRTWAEYASLYVRLGEVEQARRVVRRGLDAAQTEEGKVELFVVWLNLEAHFGQKVDEVFAEAVKYCDSKKMHKALSGVWRRASDWTKEKQSLEQLVKKHNHSRKSWLLLVERLFDQGEAAEGRKQAEKALRLLEEHKRVRFTVKQAMIEMTHDFIERGVTVFEDLISKNPKKTDIWNVYIDQLVKLAAAAKLEPQTARAVLKRACGLKLKPQSVLAFFKKWLSFEEELGDAESVAQVQTEAQNYVASQ